MQKLGKLSYFVLAVAILSSGCVAAAMVAGGAAGYVISRDKLVSYLDKPYDSIWEGTKRVIMREGFISSQDPSDGKIKAEVGGSRLWLQIEQVSLQTVRVEIKSRRGWFYVPDVGMAIRVYNKILQEIE